MANYYVCHKMNDQKRDSICACISNSSLDAEKNGFPLECLMTITSFHSFLTVRETGWLADKLDMFQYIDFGFSIRRARSSTSFLTAVNSRKKF